MSDTLLIIEDERLLGTELARHYRREGWDVVLAPTLEEGRRALLDERVEPLVVLSDMSLPDGNVLDLLEEVHASQGTGEWIVLTGYGSVPDSVRALRLGAFDFLEKPCEQDRLDMVVKGAARSARAQRRVSDQVSTERRRYAPESFLGRSRASAEVRDMLERLNDVPYTTLVITGETGTGKGLAARILHHSGPRANEPMVEINCATLPRDLLESELFGHEAGAFTGAKGRRRGLFEQANGGTLFLDEIGEMDVDLQTKLLSAIEDRLIRRIGGARPIRVDVRIITASNRDLESLVRQGVFREDLYHRLNAFQLHLPALRGRKEDLDDLVPAFVNEFNASAGKQVRHVGDRTWDRLRAHRWPGNIRELRNVIERCVLFAEGEELPERWLQLETREGDGEEPRPGPRVEEEGLWIPLDGSVSIDEVDRMVIEAALERTDANVTAAARMLGTTRETLRYRIRKHGLQ